MLNELAWCSADWWSFVNTTKGKNVMTSWETVSLSIRILLEVFSCLVILCNCEAWSSLCEPRCVGNSAEGRGSNRTVKTA
jgi:hypothetical protein